MSGHKAKIVLDSVTRGGNRLTTMEVTFPRCLLAEFNTHRQYSRNSASSRAIPVQKMLQMVQDAPYIPTSWGKNQKGMQADQDVNEQDAKRAEEVWLEARDLAVVQAKKLLELGIHKQTTNRLLEPFMWHTVIVTATEFSNFFHLRNHPAAHPDIQILAKMMQDLYEHNTPLLLSGGQWHMPYLPDYTDDIPLDTWLKVSIARCARVSYLTHDGVRNLDADIDLYDRLISGGHLSPTEHVARPATDGDVHKSTVKPLPCIGGTPPVYYPENMWFGNFKGWVQYRKLIDGESDILATKDVL